MNMRDAFGRVLADVSRALGGDGRCSTCRAWPPTRVLYSDRDDDFRREALNAWTQERFGLPTPPEQCPGCGFRPLVIEVAYVEMNIDRSHRRSIDDDEDDDIST